MAFLLECVIVSSFAATFSASLLLLLFCVIRKQSERYKFNTLFCSVILPYAGCAFFPFIQLSGFHKSGAAEIITDIKSEYLAVTVTDFAVSLNENAVAVSDMLFYLWLTVTLILIIKTAICHYRYLKFVNRLAALKFKTRHISVYSVDARIPPFITHVFNPAIYLPEDTYSENEIKMVLFHEITHFSHNDVVKRILISVLSCINWFNPLMQIILKRLILQMEYYCDEAVTKNMSFEQRKYYGYMLLQTKSLFVKQSTFGMGLTSPSDNLKRRIGIFMNKNKAINHGTKIASAVMFSLIIFMSLSISAFALTQKNTVVGNQIIQQPVNGFSELSRTGKKTPPDTVKASEAYIPTDSMYLMSTMNNRISDLSYRNGEVILVTKENGEKYFFEENCSAVINLEANFSAEYSESSITGEKLSIGYIFDNTAYELFNGRISGDGLAVDFTADQTGEYVFYLCNFSAGIQNYDNIQILIL